MPTPIHDKKPKRRFILMITAGISGTALLVILGIWGHSFFLIPELFELNRECQEEGYYMTEFEFRMLGFAYDLDKGRYLKAANDIRKLRRKLETREGLIKVPVFKNKEEEMEFYLNLQNPRTGAFMDDTHPYCTYEGPTGNVLLHLEALAKETGKPLRLKYPLKFLDEINTPEKLKVYLDDLAYIGWIASKLPESSFHMVRDLASYASEENVVNKYALYNFSTEWKQALLEWLYENQDPETGFWGPKPRRNGKLWKLDLHNTGSIVKAFVDEQGKDIYPSYPLRYRDNIFTTTLKVMSDAPPDEKRPDEWHGWTLKRWKGVMLLTRYLWNDTSKENKAKAREDFEDYIRFNFEKYYVSGRGAFSYYPNSENPTLDGTGNGIGGLELLGALTPAKQRRLWGDPSKTCVDMGSFKISALTAKDLDSLKDLSDVNSLRYYSGIPDDGNFAVNVTGIFYPVTTPVPDIVELVPKVRNWIENTPQSMGNWNSREKLRSELANIEIESVPVSKGEIPLERMNKALRESKTLTVVGFDVLQVPRCRITFVFQ